MAERLLEPTDMIIDYLCVVGAEKPVWSVESATSVTMDLNGIPDDRHYGLTRTVRRFQSTELAGREVANDRQLIIAQASDMEGIARSMNLPVEEIEQRSGRSIGHFMAEQLAVNILVDSPTDHKLSTTAVSGLVLVLGNDPRTAPAMKLGEYSRPCNQPVTQLIASLTALGLTPPAPTRELASSFKRVARTGRGWLGAVFAAGTTMVGEAVSSYPSLLPREPEEA
jgi:hypothetical protein